MKRMWWCCRWCCGGESDNEATLSQVGEFLLVLSDKRSQGVEKQFLATVGKLTSNLDGCEDGSERSSEKSDGSRVSGGG